MAAGGEPFSATTGEGAKPTFTASELVPCEACARTNPPTRTNCLYCGATLESTDFNAIQPASSASTETNGESLFYVISLAPAAPSQDAQQALSGVLDLTSQRRNSLVSHSFGALLAAKSRDEAQRICDELGPRCLETVVIANEQLAPEAAQRNIVGLEFEPDLLIGIAPRTGEKLPVRWRDVSLAVVGHLYYATAEIERKRNRRKDVLDEREFVTDEAVLDLYFRGVNAGWRIRAGGFDFSCLGKQMKLTASENFTELTQRLRERATDALCDDSYLRVRALLNEVWPIESRSGKKQRRHTAFGDYDSSATVSDNETQFTRYSRLLRFLALRNSVNDADKA